MSICIINNTLHNAAELTSLFSIQVSSLNEQSDLESFISELYAPDRIVKTDREYIGLFDIRKLEKIKETEGIVGDIAKVIWNTLLQSANEDRESFNILYNLGYLPITDDITDRTTEIGKKLHILFKDKSKEEGRSIDYYKHFLSSLPITRISKEQYLILSKLMFFNKFGNLYVTKYNTNKQKHIVFNLNNLNLEKYKDINIYSDVITTNDYGELIVGIDNIDKENYIIDKNNIILKDSVPFVNTKQNIVYAVKEITDKEGNKSLNIYLMSNQTDFVVEDDVDISQMPDVRVIDKLTFKGKDNNTNSGQVVLSDVLSNKISKLVSSVVSSQSHLSLEFVDLSKEIGLEETSVSKEIKFKLFDLNEVETRKLSNVILGRMIFLRLADLMLIDIAKNENIKDKENIIKDINEYKKKVTLSILSTLTSKDKNKLNNDEFNLNKSFVSDILELSKHITDDSKPISFLELMLKYKLNIFDSENYENVMSDFRDSLLERELEDKTIMLSIIDFMLSNKDKILEIEDIEENEDTDMEPIDTDSPDNTDNGGFDFDTINYLNSDVLLRKLASFISPNPFKLINRNTSYIRQLKMNESFILNNSYPGKKYDGVYDYLYDVFVKGDTSNILSEEYKDKSELLTSMKMILVSDKYLENADTNFKNIVYKMINTFNVLEPISYVWSDEYKRNIRNGKLWSNLSITFLTEYAYDIIGLYHSIELENQLLNEYLNADANTKNEKYNRWKSVRESNIKIFTDIMIKYKKHTKIDFDPLFVRSIYESNFNGIYIYLRNNVNDILIQKYTIKLGYKYKIMDTYYDNNYDAFSYSVAMLNREATYRILALKEPINVDNDRLLLKENLTLGGKKYNSPTIIRKSVLKFTRQLAEQIYEGDKGITLASLNLSQYEPVLEALKSNNVSKEIIIKYLHNIIFYNTRVAMDNAAKKTDTMSFLKNESKFTSMNNVLANKLNNLGKDEKGEVIKYGHKSKYSDESNPLQLDSGVYLYSLDIGAQNDASNEMHVNLVVMIGNSIYSQQMDMYTVKHQVRKKSAKISDESDTPIPGASATLELEATGSLQKFKDRLRETYFYFGQLLNMDSGMVTVAKRKQPMSVLGASARQRVKDANMGRTKMYDVNVVNVLLDPNKELSTVAIKPIQGMRTSNTVDELVKRTNSLFADGNIPSQVSNSAKQTRYNFVIKYKGVNNLDTGDGSNYFGSLSYHYNSQQGIAFQVLSPFMVGKPAPKMYANGEDITLNTKANRFNYQFLDDLEINKFLFGENKGYSIGGMMMDISINNKVNKDLFLFINVMMYGVVQEDILSKIENKDNINFVVANNIVKTYKNFKDKKYDELTKYSTLFSSLKDNKEHIEYISNLTRNIAKGMILELTGETYESFVNTITTLYNDNPEEANKRLYELFSNKYSDRYATIYSFIIDAIMNENIDYKTDNVNDLWIRDIKYNRINGLMQNIKEQWNDDFITQFNNINSLMLGGDVIRIEAVKENGETTGIKLILNKKTGKVEYSLSLKESDLLTDDNKISNDKLNEWIEEYNTFTRVFRVNSDVFASYMEMMYNNMIVFDANNNFNIKLNIYAFDSKTNDNIRSINTSMVKGIGIRVTKDSKGNIVIDREDKDVFIKKAVDAFMPFARTFNYTDLRYVRNENWIKNNKVQVIDINMDNIKDVTINTTNAKQIEGYVLPKQLSRGDILTFNRVLNPFNPDTFFNQMLYLISSYGLKGKRNNIEFNSILGELRDRFYMDLEKQINKELDNLSESTLQYMKDYLYLYHYNIKNLVRPFDAEAFQDARVSSLPYAFFSYGMQLYHTLKNSKEADENHNAGFLFFGKDTIYKNAGNRRRLLYLGDKQGKTYYHTIQSKSSSGYLMKDHIYIDLKGILKFTYILAEMTRETAAALVNDASVQKVADGSKRNSISPGVSLDRKTLEKVQIANNTPVQFRINNGIVRTAVFSELNIKKDKVQKINNLILKIMSNTIEEVNKAEYFNGIAFIPLEVYLNISILTGDGGIERNAMIKDIIDGKFTDNLKDTLDIIKHYSKKKQSLLNLKLLNSADLLNNLTYSVSMDKYSLLPIHPNMYKHMLNEEEDDILNEIYEVMKNNNLHVLTFDSGSKLDKVMNVNSRYNSIMEFKTDNGLPVKLNKDNIGNEVHNMNVNETPLEYWRLVSPKSGKVKDSVFVNVKYMLFTTLNMIQKFDNQYAEYNVEGVSIKSFKQLLYDFLSEKYKDKSEMELKQIVDSNYENMISLFKELSDAISNKKNIIEEKLNKYLGVGIRNSLSTDTQLVYTLLNDIFDGDKTKIELGMNLHKNGLSPLLLADLSRWYSKLKNSDKKRMADGNWEVIFPDSKVNPPVMITEETTDFVVNINDEVSALNMSTVLSFIGDKDKYANKDKVVLNTKVYKIAKKIELTEQWLLDEYNKWKDKLVSAGVKAGVKEGLRDKTFTLLRQKYGLSLVFLNTMIEDNGKDVKLKGKIESNKIIMLLEKSEDDYTVIPSVNNRYHYSELTEHDFKKLKERDENGKLLNPDGILIYDEKLDVPYKVFYGRAYDNIGNAKWGYIIDLAGRRVFNDRFSFISDDEKVFVKYLEIADTDIYNLQNITNRNIGHILPSNYMYSERLTEYRETLDDFNRALRFVINDDNVVMIGNAETLSMDYYDIMLTNHILKKADKVEQDILYYKTLGFDKVTDKTKVTFKIFNLLSGLRSIINSYDDVTPKDEMAYTNALIKEVLENYFKDDDGNISEDKKSLIEKWKGTIMKILEDRNKNLDELIELLKENIIKSVTDTNKDIQSSVLARKITALLEILKNRGFSADAIDSIPVEMLDLEVLLLILLNSEKRRIKISHGNILKFNLSKESLLGDKILNQAVVKLDKPQVQVKLTPNFSDVGFTHHLLHLLFIPMPIQKQDSGLLSSDIGIINMGLFVNWMMNEYKASGNKAETIENIIKEYKVKDAIIVKDDKGNIDMLKSTIAGASLFEWYNYGKELGYGTETVDYRVPLQTGASIVTLTARQLIPTHTSVRSLNPLSTHMQGADFDDDKLTVLYKYPFIKVNKVAIGDNNIILLNPKYGVTHNDYIYFDLKTLIQHMSDKNVKKVFDALKMLRDKGITDVVYDLPFDDEYVKSKFSDALFTRELNDKKITNKVIDANINAFSYPNYQFYSPVTNTVVPDMINLINPKQESVNKNSAVYQSTNSAIVIMVAQTIGGIVFTQSMSKQYGNDLIISTVLSDYINLTVDITKDDTAQRGYHYLQTSFLYEVMKYSESLNNRELTNSLFNKLNEFLNNEQVKSLFTRVETNDIFEKLLNQRDTFEKFRVANNLKYEQIVSFAKQNPQFLKQFIHFLVFPFYYKYTNLDFILPLISKQRVENPNDYLYMDYRTLQKDANKYFIDKLIELQNALSEVSKNGTDEQKKIAKSFNARISSESEEGDSFGYIPYLNDLKGINDVKRWYRLVLAILNDTSISRLREIYDEDKLNGNQHAGTYIENLELRQMIIEYGNKLNLPQETKNKVFALLNELLSAYYLIDYGVKYEKTASELMGTIKFKPSYNGRSPITLTMEYSLQDPFAFTQIVNRAIGFSENEPEADTMGVVFDTLVFNTIKQSISKKNFAALKDFFNLREENNKWFIPIRFDDNLYAITRKVKDSNIISRVLNHAVKEGDNVYINLTSLIDEGDTQMIEYINRVVLYQIAFSKLKSTLEALENDKSKLKNIGLELLKDIEVLKPIMLDLNISKEALDLTLPLNIVNREDVEINEGYILELVMRSYLYEEYEKGKLNAYKYRLLLDEMNSVQRRIIADRFHLFINKDDIMMGQTYGINDVESERKIKKQLVGIIKSLANHNSTLRYIYEYGILQSHAYSLINGMVLNENIQDENIILLANSVVNQISPILQAKYKAETSDINYSVFYKNIDLEIVNMSSPIINKVYGQMKRVGKDTLNRLLYEFALGLNSVYIQAIKGDTNGKILEDLGFNSGHLYIEGNNQSGYNNFKSYLDQLPLDLQLPEGKVRYAIRKVFNLMSIVGTKVSYTDKKININTMALPVGPSGALLLSVLNDLKHTGIINDSNIESIKKDINKVFVDYLNSKDFDPKKKSHIYPLFYMLITYYYLNGDTDSSLYELDNTGLRTIDANNVKKMFDKMIDNMEGLDDKIKNSIKENTLTDDNVNNISKDVYIRRVLSLSTQAYEMGNNVIDFLNKYYTDKFDIVSLWNAEPTNNKGFKMTPKLASPLVYILNRNRGKEEEKLYNFAADRILSAAYHLLYHTFDSSIKDIIGDVSKLPIKDELDKLTKLMSDEDKGVSFYKGLLFTSLSFQYLGMSDSLNYLSEYYVPKLLDAEYDDFITAKLQTLAYDRIDNKYMEYFNTQTTVKVISNEFRHVVDNLSIKGKESLGFDTKIFNLLLYIDGVLNNRLFNKLNMEDVIDTLLKDGLYLMNKDITKDTEKEHKIKKDIISKYALVLLKKANRNHAEQLVNLSINHLNEKVKKDNNGIVNIYFDNKEDFNMFMVYYFINLHKWDILGDQNIKHLTIKLSDNISNEDKEYIKENMVLLTNTNGVNILFEGEEQNNTNTSLQNTECQ